MYLHACAQQFWLYGMQTVGALGQWEESTIFFLRIIGSWTNRQMVDYFQWIIVELSKLMEEDETRIFAKYHVLKTIWIDKSWYKKVEMHRNYEIDPVNSKEEHKQCVAYRQRKRHK